MNPSVTYPSALSGRKESLVLDGGVAFNLCATGYAFELLTALGMPVYMETTVFHKCVEQDEFCSSLLDLGAAGLVFDHPVDESLLEHILDLVGGSSDDSISDDEALSVVLALSRGSFVVDDPKVRRAVGRRYPALQLHRTWDVLFCDWSQSRLGQAAVAEAIRNLRRVALVAVTD